MIDKNRLEQKCSMWNIALTGEQLDQLDAFAQILVGVFSLQHDQEDHQRES